MRPRCTKGKGFYLTFQCTIRKFRRCAKEAALGDLSCDFNLLIVCSPSNPLDPAIAAAAVSDS
jgi:hypothetical protein